MKSSAIVLVAVLLSATALQPANAAGLLGGASNAVGSVGGSGSNGNVGVSGVATANSSSDGGGTSVNGTLLGGGGGTANVGLGSVLGGDSNVGLNLPGTGDSNLDGTLGDTAGTANGIADNGGDASTLLGDTGLTGTQGGLGGAIGGSGGLLGNNGDGTGGIGGNGGIGGYGSGSGSMAGLFGAYANSPACRQDTAALAQLLRTPYSSGTANRWSHASGVQVVKVPVCAQLKGRLGKVLATNSNMGRMQEMAEADPLISTSLARSSVNPRHVLGVGQGRNGVTVYVY